MKFFFGKHDVKLCNFNETLLRLGSSCFDILYYDVKLRYFNGVMLRV